MSEQARIDLGEPQDPYRPYTHLVPLVEDLVRRGNRLTITGKRGEAFVSTQGGYNAYLAEPLDMAYLRATYDLGGYSYDAATDRLTDGRNWVSVYGSDSGR
ncbi:hypothetical protein DQ239_14385 [Blastococcus sp. TF02-09]|uniref:hypothetical protein n=1 Tax=Blastococcus sp. TF02-09 TaxID=2250576 RepID=UPI000DEB7850|nr:hypothetical protein [Blastococcus sp. TF02-9]RBY76183.1 hypothetical protein DQ239_14385 [Blastococcus sp. TF02-9]